jgi:hypothetical protein
MADVAEAPEGDEGAAAQWRPPMKPQSPPPAEPLPPLSAALGLLGRLPKPLLESIVLEVGRTNRLFYDACAALASSKALRRALLVRCARATLLPLDVELALDLEANLALLEERRHAYRPPPPPVGGERTCRDCGSPFWLGTGEKQWFLARRLFLPRRCKSCRQSRRCILLESSSSSSSSSSDEGKYYSD